MIVKADPRLLTIEPDSVYRSVSINDLATSLPRYGALLRKIEQYHQQKSGPPSSRQSGNVTQADHHLSAHDFAAMMTFHPPYTKMVKSIGSSVANHR